MVVMTLTFDLQEKYGDTENAVKCAIDCGYRYFDSSLLYWNEAEIGQALHDKISEKIIIRKDIWVTNKIWCTQSKPEIMENICRESLGKLKLEYMDLYLLHLPTNFTYIGEEKLFPLFSEPKHKLRYVNAKDRKTKYCMVIISE